MQNVDPDPSAASDQSAELSGLIDALVQTSFVTMGLLNKVAAEHDMSLTQLRVLAILRDRRLKMTELADYLGLDKSTMTGLVDRAEKRGLLERVRNRVDGRAVDVRITKLGAELAERLATVVAQSLSPKIGALPRVDRRRLQELLKAMLDG